MRGGALRIEGEGLPVVGQRFFLTIERGQCGAARDKGSGEAWIERDRLVLGGEGFVEALQGRQRQALVEMGRGELGIERDSLVEIGKREPIVADVVEHCAAVIPVVRDFVVQGEGAGELLERFFQLAALLQDQAVVVLRNVRTLVERDRPRDHRLGIGETLQVEQRDGQQIERADVIRMVGQEAAELSFGIGEPALLQRGQGVSVLHFASIHQRSRAPRMCAAGGAVAGICKVL